MANSNVIVPMVAAGIAAISVIYTAIAIEQQPEVALKPDPPKPPSAKVLQAKAEIVAFYFEAHGEAKPEFQLQLQSEVSGRVEKIYPIFEVGKQVVKGSPLLQLDRRPYLQQWHSAKQALAEAKLLLAEAHRDSEQALRDWQGSRTGKQKIPTLVAKKPQLELAQARMQQAQAQLVLAKRDLDNTLLRAPFDAIITERNIAPGQLLQANRQLASLYSTQRLDMVFKLPQQQWRNLKSLEQQKKHIPITIENREGHRWQGYIQQIQHHIDSRNRQRSLVVSIKQPLQQIPALLPGSYVKMSFEIDSQQALIKLPASSLGPNGNIWQVNTQNILSSFKPDIISQNRGWIFITPPQQAATSTDQLLRILRKPNPSFKLGQAITPELIQANPKTQEKPQYAAN